MKKVIFIKTALTLLFTLVLTAMLPTSFQDIFLNDNVSIVKAQEEDEVYLNETSKSLVRESTFTLKVFNYDIESTQKISFKSSNTEVASVSSKGVVTANKIGTATITVTVRKLGKNNIDSLECEITVGPPAISLKLSKTGLKLLVGDKTTVLKSILKPNNTADEVSYISTDTNVATVSGTGRIIARNPGEALIIASAGSVYDICSVTVVATSEELQETAN